MHLHHWSAAVQFAFGGQSFRAPLIPFATDVDVGKIRRNTMPVAHVHAGADVHSNVGCNVDGDVAGASLEVGIVTLAAGVNQLHGDSSRPGFCARRRHTVQLDASAPSLGLDMAFGARQVNAAASGLNSNRTIEVAQINAASAG